MPPPASPPPFVPPALPPAELLGAVLRPAGGGVFLVSTGKAEQERLQQRIYGAARAEDVDGAWREALGRLGGARGFVLGIPSDTGAGFRRGANLGPSAVRAAILDAIPDWPARAAAAGLVDVGDVFTVPQLQEDSMLSLVQLEATRRALYPAVPEAARATLPASPLSIAEAATDAALRVSPAALPFAIGGDHSTAWPVFAALHRARAAHAPSDRLAIVQVDAHTDLLEERLGVRLCFATWSFHANELLGRDGRLVQVGIRATRYPRAHWEQGLGVKQVWADEVRADPARAVGDVVAHLKARGVTHVYFSNDVDGTDDAWASATGTPESGGLAPDDVLALVDALGDAFQSAGGDIMEVAPPLGPTPERSAGTVRLGARYFVRTVERALGVALGSERLA